MRELAFRETVTAIDVLDTGACIKDVLTFVAEFGAISVVTSAFPDSPLVQSAAMIYDDKDWNYGEDYGDAKGDGHSHSYLYYFDYRPGLFLGYSNGLGNGFGFGLRYGNSYHSGDGSGYGDGYGDGHGDGSGSGEDDALNAQNDVNWAGVKRPDTLSSAHRTEPANKNSQLSRTCAVAKGLMC